MADESYLQPGFDPNSLKVAELRGLLLQYNVEYPSSAKKAQLVELFLRHITPQSQTLLGEKGRIRASTRGIQDVDQNGNAIPPTTPAARTRSRSRRRTTSRYAVADSADGDDTGSGDPAGVLDSVTISPVKASYPPAAQSPTKRALGRRSMAPSYTDTAEPEASPAKRSTRKSLPSRPVNPPIIQDDPEPDQQQLPPLRPFQGINKQEESVFSSENPFQSGSSPPSVRSPGTSSSRRKSMPKGGTAERSASKPSSRRVTDFPTPTASYKPERNRLSGGPYDTPDTAPTSKRYEFPVSRIQQQQQVPPPRNSTIKRPPTIKKEEEAEDSYDDHDLDQDLDQDFDDQFSQEVEPGEEFTPEGTQEVIKHESENGTLVRRRPTRSSPGPGPASFVWAVVATLLGAYFMWWRKEKLEIGYCNVGRANFNPHHDSEPAWVAVLRPDCEPCPQNAICKPHFEAECKDDYELATNPLSFGGLIPLPPSCEPDSEKLRRIQILEEEVLRILRQREADVECGEVTLAPGEARGVAVAELKKRLYAQKAPKLSDSQFDELFKAAEEELVTKEEIERTEEADIDTSQAASTNKSKTSDPSTSSTHLTAHTTTYFRSTSPTLIPLTCSLRLTLKSYTSELSLALLLVLLSFSLQHHITRRRATNALIAKYVHLALQHLSRPENAGTYVAVVQLRDQVLQHEFDAGKRRRVWEGVQRVVENNSNVRASQREVVGEVLRCWCWIGPAAIEGGRRRAIESGEGGREREQMAPLTRREREEMERDVLVSRQGRVLA